jgi:hypothetical protein
VDAQNQEVSLTLFEPRFGGALDDTLFQYDKPAETRGPDRRGE